MDLLYYSGVSICSRHVFVLVTALSIVKQRFLKALYTWRFPNPELNVHASSSRVWFYSTNQANGLRSPVRLDPWGALACLGYDLVVPIT